MNIEPHISKLLNHIESQRFVGYDPYDALNSPLLKTLSFNQKYIRIVFIQAFKRLPINLRPLVGIRKEYNPKALGLFLWGYAKLYRIRKKAEYLRKVDDLLGLLEQLKCKGYSGNCWGYNFDWQSRAFYIPKDTPTIVNSSFIGHALIDTYRYTCKEKALEMAIPIKDFILNDLNRKEENGNICFSYTPIDTTSVHNANLLGSSLLIRLCRYESDEHLKSTALRGFAYTMKCQRENGSWFYADADYQRWIDSFHTCFNLQSILYFLEEGFGKEYQGAFEKGVQFYRKIFFLDDGTPKYYHNRIYPVDIHSPAEAVVFFSKMGDSYKRFSEHILQWMIRNMQDRKGYFYFQKMRNYKNKIPYMRWSQAWAFHALTEYLLNSG
jgi:hypothetical protein